MQDEVINFFQFQQTFEYLGYFETPENNQLMKSLKRDLSRGGLIVLSGIVGSGKTTLLLQVQRELKQEAKVVVSRSISVDINNG
ncbi:GTP-binding protein [Lyngbya sp. PCC 8106]|uniref:GTP-binding protein n=1 Tax=Lyngbya sp. (strain PCC 8106) TaxID=313612 RepID=UPI0000EA8CDD|nr:GTP-binding protein [Lyngbya sp. PCC 8106]EAW36284.1 hypothetical protein L8106_23181 [Lyngbya sp. PCC 8106]